MSDNRALARTAASQFGLLTLAQQREHGVSPDVVQHRRLTGRYELVAPRVDAIAGVPDTFERTIVAGCLSIGGLVAGSHRTATRLHGLGTFEHPVELIVAYSRDPVPPGYDVH